MTVTCYGSGSQTVVPGPEATASPETLSEMLILCPAQIHLVRNAGAGAQQSGLWQAFQVILLHAQMWATELQKAATPLWKSDILIDGLPYWV